MASTRVFVLGCLLLCLAAFASADPCPTGCESCDNEQACTDCSTGYFRNPPFSDGNSGQCSRCIVGCDTCADDTTCTDCRSGWSKLNDGTICEQCPPGCAVCSGTTSATTCDECDSGRYKAADGSCVYSCPDGEYEVVEDQDGEIDGPRECNNCPSGCKTCTQNEDVAQDPECFNCENDGTGNPTFYQDGACGTDCDPGTYKDVSGFVCAPCPHACAECSDRDTCTVCEANFVKAAESASCVLNCEDDEWENAGQCVKCSGDCATCTSASECLTCKTLLLNSDTKECVSQESCPSDTYPNLAAKHCSPCSRRCQTCSGPGRDCGGQATTAVTTSGPSTTGPSTTGPSTTGPSTTGPSTTGPSTTGPSTTGPSTTGPSTTGPSTTGPSTTGPSTTGPSTTGPSTTEPTTPEPTTPEPTTPEPTTPEPTTPEPTTPEPTTPEPTTPEPTITELP